MWTGLTSKGPEVVAGILGKVQRIEHDGDHADHPGVDCCHVPCGVTSLAGAGHYVVGGGEAEGLDLDKVLLDLESPQEEPFPKLGSSPQYREPSPQPWPWAAGGCRKGQCWQGPTCTATWFTGLKH